MVIKLNFRSKVSLTHSVFFLDVDIRCESCQLRLTSQLFRVATKPSRLVVVRVPADMTRQAMLRRWPELVSRDSTTDNGPVLVVNCDDYVRRDGTVTGDRPPGNLSDNESISSETTDASAAASPTVQPFVINSIIRDVGKSKGVFLLNFKTSTRCVQFFTERFGDMFDLGMVPLLAPKRRVKVNIGFSHRPSVHVKSFSSRQSRSGSGAGGAIDETGPSATVSSELPNALHTLADAANATTSVKRPMHHPSRCGAPDVFRSAKRQRGNQRHATPSTGAPPASVALTVGAGVPAAVAASAPTHRSFNPAAPFAMAVPPFAGAGACVPGTMPMVPFSLSPGARFVMPPYSGGVPAAPYFPFSQQQRFLNLQPFAALAAYQARLVALARTRQQQQQLLMGSLANPSSLGRARDIPAPSTPPHAPSKM